MGLIVVGVMRADWREVDDPNMDVLNGRVGCEEVFQVQFRARIEEVSDTVLRCLWFSSGLTKEFWKQARLHALLRQFAEENRGSQWANVTALTSPGRGPSGWSSYWGWGVAAATTLALLLMMWKPWQVTGPDLAGGHTSSGQPSEVPVAVLARTVGCVFPTGTPPLQAGAELVPSKLQLEAGLVQLDFFSGARVVLEGPAELELLAPDHARLSYGKATCEVAVPGRGFRLSAPGMNVLDLGTAFGLLAPRNGPPEVHVLDGKVAVSQDRQGVAANAASEVLASAAVRLTSSGFTATSFNPAEFTRTQDMRRKQEIVARTQQQHWETAARALDADPTILVHYTFEGTETSLVANRAKTVHGGHGWDDHRLPAGRRPLARQRSPGVSRTWRPRLVERSRHTPFVDPDGLAAGGCVHTTVDRAGDE